MNGFVGTAALLRLGLRHDRILIPSWIVALVALTVLRVSNVMRLHPTQQSLEEFARVAQDSPASAALNGLPVALDTVGGRVAFEILVTFGVTLGLMSLLMVVRHTRAEEQAGRTELLRSGVVGHHAQPAAALLLVVATNLAIAVLTTAILVSFDLPVAGSVVLAASAAMVGIVFATVAAVTAQLAARPRVANGLAGGLLGASFAVRAIGDTGVGWLSGLSPIGWAQSAEPYGHDRWWPLLAGLLVAALLLMVAFRLAGRRDLGSGLLRTRPGPSHGSAGLTSPLGLAVRLHRGALVGWLVGVTAYGAVFGLVGREIEQIAESAPGVAELLSAGDGQLLDSYLATVAAMLALITVGSVIQGLLRMRAEESEGRAELVLTGPVGRLAWAGSHVAVVAAGSVAILGVSGATIGLVHGLRADEMGWTGEMAVATVTQLPAVWVIAGFALLLYGVAPRLVPLSWAVLGVTTVIAFLGEPTQLPAWVRDLSPFTHLPRLPADELSLAAPTLLLAVAGALAAVGLATWRRRDLQT